MKNFVKVYSDNMFFHSAIDVLFEESFYLNIPCCGKLVIVDTGNISPLSQLDFPEPVCHVVFVVSRESHKAYLSSFAWGVSVSYVNAKCNMDYLKVLLHSKIFDLKGRRGCRAFYNENTCKALSDKELMVAASILRGESIIEISNILNIHVKTVLNYRTQIIKKAFEILDVKGIRVFHLTRKLNAKLSVGNALTFDNKKKLYCDVNELNSAPKYIGKFF